MKVKMTRINIHETYSLADIAIWNYYPCTWTFKSKILFASKEVRIVKRIISKPILPVVNGLKPKFLMIESPLEYSFC